MLLLFSYNFQGTLARLTHVVRWACGATKHKNQKLGGWIVEFDACSIEAFGMM